MATTTRTIAFSNKLTAPIGGGNTISIPLPSIWVNISGFDIYSKKSSITGYIWLATNSTTDTSILLSTEVFIYSNSISFNNGGQNISQWLLATKDLLSYNCNTPTINSTTNPSSILITSNNGTPVNVNVFYYFTYYNI